MTALLMSVVCLANVLLCGLDIGCAIINFKNKHWVLGGIGVSLALWCAAVVLKFTLGCY